MTDKNTAAESNMGLVHACCKRFTGRGIEYEELFSAGCLGLAKAINNFDESRQLQFSTYAFPVIMGEIKRLFRDGGAVKVSRALKELAVKVCKLNNESRLKHGCDLTISQLAEELEVSEEKITDALNCVKYPLSLTAEYDDEGNPQLDIPVDDIQEEISERLSVREAVGRLEESDRKIIDLRYYQNKTQVQTAEILDMTQVQVSRRERKILTEMRKVL
ncbi:MAG: sigma-70 family RNA polymerase sigma factor [Clostridiales bacterium]|nr:sigma-70 family RNA polymerase sigma factor [Clostridiales bacterium]